MEVFLSLVSEPKYLDGLAMSFAEDVTEDIKMELARRVPKDRMQIYLDNLMTSPHQLDWNQVNRVELTVDQFYQLFLMSLIPRWVDGKIFITPDVHMYYPGTSTDMSQIYKYLSYGDGNLNGIHQIPRIFSDYSRTIGEAWKIYKDNAYASGRFI